MADPVTQAGEQAANAAEAIVGGAVAEVQADLAAAEARAEAAEAVNEALTESARRDVLHDEIEEVSEGIEQWQEQHDHVHSQLDQRLMAMEARCNSLEERLTETLSKITVLTVSTPPLSEQPEASPAPAQVSVTTVDPNSPAVAAGPQAAAPKEKAPRWI